MSIWRKEQDPQKTGSEMLDIEIAALNLSVRSFNCLKRAGCNTVRDVLVRIADDENGLRKIRNLGSRSEEEILTCIQKYREDLAKSGGSLHDRNQQKKTVIIKPAKKWWDTEIEAFHLSNYALTRLKQKGINLVRDLYATNPKQEPGWYAVRELFEKIPSANPRT